MVIFHSYVSLPESKPCQPTRGYKRQHRETEKATAATDATVKPVKPIEAILGVGQNVMLEIPSGYVKIAIENGNLYWVFPFKMVIFHSYVSLPEGMVYLDFFRGMVMGKYRKIWRRSGDFKPFLTMRFCGTRFGRQSRTWKREVWEAHAGSQKIEKQMIKRSWEAVFRVADDFYSNDFTSHNNTSQNNMWRRVMTKVGDEGWWLREVVTTEGSEWWRWLRVMTKDGEVVTNGSDDPGAVVT